MYPTARKRFWATVWQSDVVVFCLLCVCVCVCFCVCRAGNRERKEREDKARLVHLSVATGIELEQTLAQGGTRHMTRQQRGGAAPIHPKVQALHSLHRYSCSDASFACWLHGLLWHYSTTTLNACRMCPYR